MRTVKFNPAMYILDADRKPVEVSYDRWLEDSNSRGRKYPCVADAEVVPGVRVLTQFIGTDPGGDPKNPALFETMIHGGDFDGYTQRTACWENANRCHFNTFDRVKRWINEDREPADFIQDIDVGLLVRWGFCPTDEGGEYERTIRGAEEVPGFDGLNLVVRPDDGAVCLIEYDAGGNTLETVALPNKKTLGGVMRLVNALKGEL